MHLCARPMTRIIVECGSILGFPIFAWFLEDYHAWFWVEELKVWGAGPRKNAEGFRDVF